MLAFKGFLCMPLHVATIILEENCYEKDTCNAVEGLLR